MKIRIFALAKELGIDSKELIEHCNNAGVKNLKSSPLASISPEERDIVVNYMRQEGTGADKSSAKEPLVPVREEASHTAGKVRSIKTIAPRPQNGRSSRTEAAEARTAKVSTAEAPAAESLPDRVAEPAAETAVADEPAAKTAVPETPATEQPAELEPAAEGAEPEAPAKEAEAKEVDETEAEEMETPAAATASPEAPPPAKPSETQDDTGEDKGEQREFAPIRRDDYVSAAGTSGSKIREMRPRGTIPDSESRPERRGAKGKPKSTLPNIAAPPAYKPPKPKSPKREETPAQKPDIPLTAEALEQQSPLGGHLRKHAEQKKGKKKGTAADLSDQREAAKRGGKPGGPAAESGRPARRDKRKMGRRFQDDTGDERGRVPRRPRKRTSGPVTLKTSAQIEHPITVRSLSEAMGRPAKDLMRSLFQKGEMVTINENLSEEAALELALEFGVDLEIKRARNIEDELVAALEAEDPEETLVPRPPIITILGHVDHGKTTLLDKLRAGNVAGGEAGGITQHIAAYQVEHNGQKLAFVDTPGHAAFGEMRARGANVTDIVVLVVAADDGVMPQTVECISHAKSAGVPVVVAMNKIDRPDTNEQKVLQELAAQDVLPAEWGGDTEVVRTSAITGQGLDDLLETLLVTAELQEYKVNPDRPAVGVCLEAFRDEGRGALAWLIVQKGTLRIGDIVLCGPAYGRIRAIYNDRDEEIEEAGPSTPVKVAGLDIVPGAGDHFFVMSDIEEARETAEARLHRGRTELLARRGRPRTLEDILNEARGGIVQDLPLIVKADTPGSLEALRSEIEKFDHPEVRVEIVHEGVGGVNESDVYLASASGAIIIAFHVVPEDRAQQLAEREGVDIRRYNIIYEVTETIKRTLEGLLIPERVEVATGRALVLQTFHISRYGTIAGCRVLSGTIERSHRLHVIRDQKVLNDYNIASLKREKDDVKEVREGMECGIRLDGFNDVKEGDLLEAYKVEEVKRTLD